ncbi:MAG: helix-turn-helix domain-containing protein [Nanoarchaeota archaeon]
MNIELPLKEYGLSDKEITVYLALLPLGTVNLQEIAKRVEFPRSTVYNTLNYLAQKGLVSKIVKGNITFFTATEPKRLKETLEEKKKLIEAILPNLQILKESVKESSSVEIYEGFKGIYTILSDVFKVNQQTYYLGAYKQSLEILKHLPEHTRMMRLEKRIPAKIVIEPSDEAIFHTKKYQQLTEMRFLASMKDFPCMIFIYGKKVALFTLQKDLIGIIINNEQVSLGMKMIFDMYWSQAKPTKF